jgi:hypothetical protein
VVESDDGGSSWPIDLQAGSTSTRPKFVVTHLSADQNPAHFDLYYSGRLATCSNTPQAGTGQRCPTNTGNSWAFVPNIPGTNMNHDINGIAISPKTDNCAVYEVSDFGVMRKGNAVPGNACGSLGTWTLPGNSEAGFGALQIYQVAGQVQYPVTGGGINISGYTTLFFGTMDNLEWANHDAAVPGWQAFGAEGSFLQVLNDTTLAAQPADLELNFVDFGGGGIGDFKNVPNIAAGTWANMQPWTAVTPPGNGSPVFIVAAHTYVEWSGTTLLVTQDSGLSWTPVGILPAGQTTFNGIQVADTGQGPAIYEMVADSAGNQGIALLVHFLPPPATPKAFEIQTLNGTNNRGNPSGLKAIWGNCFGQGAWYCAPVYAANPKDYRILYAVDSAQRFVAVSRDAGETWQEDFGLTNLVTAGGVPFTDSIGDSQIHLFAFDPANPSHILVGTDEAGLFASANGGLTWSTVPNTAQARAISSIFFDARTQTIYVGTYGRGLWKLIIDWTTVH